MDGEKTFGWKLGWNRFRLDGEKTFGWKLGWNRFRLNAVEIGWNVVDEPPDETGSTLEQSWMESGWKPGMDTLDGNLGWTLGVIGSTF